MKKKRSKLPVEERVYRLYSGGKETCYEFSAPIGSSLDEIRDRAIDTGFYFGLPVLEEWTYEFVGYSIDRGD